MLCSFVEPDIPIFELLDYQPMIMMPIMMIKSFVNFVGSFFSAASWAGPVTFHPYKYTEIEKFEKKSLQRHDKSDLIQVPFEILFLA